MTVLTRTTTSPDTGDTIGANMRNTQSTKNAGSRRFCWQTVERDFPGAAVAAIVEKSWPVGAITYQAAIAINHVSAATTVVSAV